jgi:MFS family permease
MSSPVENPSGETPTSVGVLLAILVCLPVAGILLIAQVLPQLQAEFKAVPNVEMLSAITLTIPALMVAVFSWPAGWLADRFGRKNLLLVGLVLYAAFGMSPLLLAGLPAILAARALMGLAEGIVIITSTALIGDFFAGKRREKFLSLQVFLSSLSAVIFAVLGGVLGESGWRTPFWVYAISLLLFVPVAVMIREPEGGARSAVATAGDTALPPFPLRLVLSIAAISLVASIAFFAPQIEVPFRLNEIGVMSPQSIGLVSGLANLGIMAGTIGFVLAAR